MYRLSTLISALSLSGLLLLSNTANAAPQQGEAAIKALLEEAKTQHLSGNPEQSAVLLERALRIAPQQAVLWHNLAGVTLEQKDWQKAASLAAKSNTFAGNDKWLRIRNWTVIALACQGMGDADCMREAQSRAQALNH